MSALKELIEAIREACSPGTWSRGVQLARAGAVIGEADEGAEIVLRVSVQGGLNSLQVVLFPEEIDWTCDCNFREDACPHVCAAAIALKQAREDGLSLPGENSEDAPGRLGYRLDGRSGKLMLHRVVINNQGMHQLDGSLAAIKAGKIKAPKFIATADDLAFEKKLGIFAGGVIPRQLMPKVLDALKGISTLKVDGEPGRIAAPSCGLAARVTEQGAGFLVRLEQDQDINEVYENGAFRKGTSIAPIGAHGLSEAEFVDLRRGKTFPASQVGTLVGDLLPRLRRRLSVVIDAGDLPGAKTVKPRIALQTERVNDQLTVLPTVVYGQPPIARVDGERLTMLREGDVPLRNVRLEKILRKKIETLGFEPGKKDTLSAASAIGLASRVAGEADLRIQGDYGDFYAAGELAPHLEVDDEGHYSVWFSPEAGAEKGSSDSGGGARIDPAAVLRAWERGDEFAPLIDGGFGRIPVDWLTRYGDKVAGLLAAREASQDEEAPASGWALADLAALCEALDRPPPPGFDRLKALLQDFEGIAEPELPEDLAAELRDYQREGVAWLHFLREAGLGALLADDMGLGKTLQTLCAVQGRTLVVAPTSVLHNWAAEIEKFRPSLRVCIYHGSNRKLDPEADVTLTTYALLRLDVNTLIAESWDTVVIDEAQAIKNPESQVAQAAYRFENCFRVALTGTPVENRLDDLWSQFHFLNPGLLFGRSEFNDRYVKAIGIGDQGAAEALRERIRPFVLRRLKRDVASELPPRTDVVLRCELDKDERRVYDAVRAATQESVVSQLGSGGNVMKMLEALLRLRQASCHPALVPGQASMSDRVSSKIALLLETLDEAIAEGHKALVFSQWTSLLDLVGPQLEASNIGFVRLDGSTRDRATVVDTFQDPEGPPVMLISLRAGGTGLNLTAADHVFLLDPWWNPAVEDQAADRAHRIGQDRPVLVHRLVARDTVEERILALQDRKRQLAEAAVGQAGQAAQITREELLALLD